MVSTNYNKLGNLEQQKKQNVSSPSPENQMSEVKGSQGWAPCRVSRGGSSPPLPASGGSRRPSLGWAPCRVSRGGSSPPRPASGGSRRPSQGWWPPPSRLRLRLHVASPLCPCLSSSVSDKDPVPGFRAAPIQERLMSDPSLHNVCKHLLSK